MCQTINEILVIDKETNEVLISYEDGKVIEKGNLKLVFVMGNKKVDYIEKDGKVYADIYEEPFELKVSAPKEITTIEVEPIETKTVHAY